MPEIFVAIKRILWPLCGNETCATNVEDFNEAKGLKIHICFGREDKELE